MHAKTPNAPRHTSKLNQHGNKNISIEMIDSNMSVSMQSCAKMLQTESKLSAKSPLNEMDNC